MKFSTVGARSKSPDGDMASLNRQYVRNDQPAFWKLQNNISFNFVRSIECPQERLGIILTIVRDDAIVFRIQGPSFAVGNRFHPEAVTGIGEVGKRLRRLAVQK